MKKILQTTVFSACSLILFSAYAASPGSYVLNCDPANPMSGETQKIKLEMSGGTYSNELKLNGVTIEAGFVEAKNTLDGRHELSIITQGENDQGFATVSKKVLIDDKLNPIGVKYHAGPTDLKVSLLCWVASK